MIKKYDPNNRFTVHTVEVIFMQWNSTRKVSVDITGNCKGKSILESASDKACELLLNERSKNGHVKFSGGLQLDYSSFDDETDLEKMIVSIQILNVKKAE